MTTERTLLTYYVLGGPIMHLMLLMSIAALTITMERLYHLQRARTDHRKLLADVKELLVDDLVYKAIARCDADRGPVAHVLKAVIKNKDRDSETKRDAIDLAALEEIPRLERRVAFLGSIANIATLLGLLGTTTGMIRMFQGISETATGLVNVKVMSNGIWEAMLCTAFGLSIAIPVSLAHTFITTRIKDFAVAMEHSSAELVHFIEHQPRKNADEV